MQTEEIKVWFAHLANGPISYHRMIQFAYEMSDMEGIYPIMTPFRPKEHDKFRRNYEINPDQEAEHMNQLAELSDVIIAQSIGNMKLLAYMKSYQSVLGKLFISEFDDNPFEIDSSAQHYNALKPGSDLEHNAYDQIKASDAVICSTQYLADQISVYNGEVYVIPNAIDLDVWEPLESKNKDGIVTIGWAGGAGHQHDLKPIRQALIEILERHPNVEVKFIHGAPDFIDHKRFSCVGSEWKSINDYPASYADAGFDIVLAPLKDTEFNRCKSNLRYLEASALKLPTVAANVEPYKQSIKDEEDGFIYCDRNNLVDILSQLVYNPSLRRTVGQSAFEKVKTQYSSRVVAQEYANTIKTIFEEHCCERLSNSAK